MKLWVENRFGNPKMACPGWTHGRFNLRSGGLMFDPCPSGEPPNNYVGVLPSFQQSSGQDGFASGLFGSLIWKLMEAYGSLCSSAASASMRKGLGRPRPMGKGRGPQWFTLSFVYFGFPQRSVDLSCRCQRERVLPGSQRETTPP